MMTFGIDVAWTLLLFQALVAAIGVTFSAIELFDTVEDLKVCQPTNGPLCLVAKAAVELEATHLTVQVILLILSLSVAPFLPAATTISARMLFNRIMLMLITTLLAVRSVRAERHRHAMLRIWLPSGKIEKDGNLLKDGPVLKDLEQRRS